MTLVLDANVVVGECLAEDGFGPYGDEELVAPPLMWSEVLNAFHQGVYRGAILGTTAREAVDRLERAHVRPRTPRRLRAEAWRLADRLGWAKTYDAEYVALAALEGCPLLTLDGRLYRGTRELGFVLTPTEWITGSA